MNEPAWATVDEAPAPDAVFERIAHLPYAVWLDSSSHEAGAGRWSFVAAQPFGVLQAREGRAFWIAPGSVRPLETAPLAAVAGRLARPGDRNRTRIGEDGGGFPFDGGAAGFIGYETAAAFERLPPVPPRDQALPDLHLAFFDVVIGWDHASGICRVVSTGRPQTGAAGRERADARLAETVDWLAGGRALRPTIAPPPQGEGAATATRVPDWPLAEMPWLASTASREEYEEAVARIIAAIRRGDVYQVNLSQRFAAETEATPLALHRVLRRRSPAPHGAVVRVGRTTVVSSSPETFLRVDGDGHVEARPIKGTRPRGDDDARDAELADELLASEKDRAENLMIVDLLRNDLSRVCRPGSIFVPELFSLESWATVHHLVSSIRGRLREDVGVHDLLGATFPCGSVTGAPKLRAMQMIAELERVARGPYCGAIGYFGFGGAVDLSVAIRILVHEAGRATFHAGGGVVYDSNPGDEYDETLAKARGIIDALEEAG